MLLTHAKPNIKAKALEVFLLMFEVTEVFNDSIDTMKTLLAHKNVKVSFSWTIIFKEDYLKDLRVLSKMIIKDLLREILHAWMKFKARF